MGMERHCFPAPADAEHCRPPVDIAPRETQLQFLTRRAFEETSLAGAAATAKAAAAHRYLAAAYSAAIGRELAAAAELEELARQIP